MTEVKERKPAKELTVKKLREKGVKPRPEALEMSKEQRKIIKQIKECLKAGPKTIPEIAAELGMRPGVVMFYVMTLHKYGEILHGDEVDGYYQYMLPEVEKEEEE